MSVGARLASPSDEIDTDRVGERPELLTPAQELGHGLAALVAVVLCQLVHVHGHEPVRHRGVDPAPEPERVLEGFGPVVEPALDRLPQHVGDLREHLWSEVPPSDVDAERQRQPGLEEPPLAEVEHFCEAVILERELTFVDQEACMRSTGRDLLWNLVEGELPEAEVAEDEPQREERRRHRPRHDDLELRKLFAGERATCDHDRPVPGADACPVRKERVVLLHERIRGERERGHLEPPRSRPLVQRLDVGEYLLELVAPRFDPIARERPEHERVVGIGTVTDADPHGAAR
ncbi:hypothetical protein BH20ACT14_BH20ACT14_18360 [soil metagenome]